jgi:uncharacterized protein with NAD-binding domain and iron-sulfur cluster
MQKQRILILGGGIAGLTAAYHLTETPARRERYQVTILQQGWRLGGQAASGRGANGRIEEHGLHLLLGFYENAFSLMRAVYQELARPASAPIATWRHAFDTIDAVTMHESIEGDLSPWVMSFPKNSRTPGDGGLLLGPSDYLRMLPGAAQLLSKSLLSSWRSKSTKQLKRRSSYVLNLIQAVTRGMAADRVLSRGFDSIDDEDFGEWLARHGARPEVVRSAIIKTAYDLVFAAPKSDNPSSGLAAGVGLRFYLRALFGYKGSIGWPMRAGTGDILIAPLYELLKRRGVLFQFFHRVRELHLDEDNSELRGVTLGVQARTNKEYQPLVEINGLPSWPAAPCWEQLTDAERWRSESFEASHNQHLDAEVKTLKRGEDFDQAVLAVSVGAVPFLCPRLKALPRWASMFSYVKTAATICVQTWSSEAGDEAAPLMGNSGLPTLGGVGDMSRLLQREQWPDEVKHVLHACHRIEDDEYEREHSRALDGVKRLARSWVEQGGSRMIPAVSGATPRWEGLFDQQSRAGAARLGGQYLRINTEPTDRYVLSIPGSTRYRLAADESGINGLTLAGAWLKTGLNLGAVESAVMSGMQAARALTGSPIEIPGERW